MTKSASPARHTSPVTSQSLDLHHFAPAREGERVLDAPHEHAWHYERVLHVDADSEAAGEVTDVAWTKQIIIHTIKPTTDSHLFYQMPQYNFIDERMLARQERIPPINK